MNTPFFSYHRINDLMNLEVAIVLNALAAIAFLIYKLFLQRLSQERHENLQGLFQNLWGHLLGLWILIGFYSGAQELFESRWTNATSRAMAYLGFVVILQASAVAVKASKILLFEYLFMGHMQRGVPLLLIDIFKLLLSLAIAGYLATVLFGLQLAPLLATSAVFSIVLGLALQDTLGNLFAGIALQFDKPYKIGDWIEVSSDGGKNKWVGQVQEISWRGTLLIAITEELITIPNRVMAQAQISNFSAKDRPIIRSQYFRFAYDSDLEGTRECLLRAAQDIDGICQSPKPLVLINETTESWIGIKLVYYIENYGNQYTIADQVLMRSLKILKEARIELAGPRLQVRLGDEDG